MAFIDDAGLGAPETYVATRQSRHREFLTLAIMVGCVGFWMLVLWAFGAL